VPKIVDHESRRAEYLDALWRVVDRDGVAALSVRTVAAEAGVSKSSIGHYFGSQADLIAAAVAQQIAVVNEQIGALDLAALDEEGAVDALMLAIPTTDHRRRMSRVWLMLLSRQGEDPDMRRVLRGLDAAVGEGILRLVEQMAQAGLVGAGRDPGAEAGRLHALVDGLSLRALGGGAAGSRGALRAVLEAQVHELGHPLS